jgi:hypothetical protein
MAGRRSERPTLAPAFNVEAFARESDQGMAAALAPPAATEFSEDEQDTKPSQVRLVTRPRWGDVLTNEAWARSMSGAPAVTMTNEALKCLPLDHRAGFLMSLMDGSLDLDTIVDLCGIERDEALGIMRDLFESGVLEFK